MRKAHGTVPGLRAVRSVSHTLDHAAKTTTEATGPSPALLAARSVSPPLDHPPNPTPEATGPDRTTRIRTSARMKARRITRPRHPRKTRTRTKDHDTEPGLRGIHTIARTLDHA